MKKLNRMMEWLVEHHPSMFGGLIGLCGALVAIVVIGLFDIALAQQGPSSQTVDLGVNPSAKYAATTTEVLVLNGTATAMPATAQSPRKSLEIQNLGPNDIYCCIGTVASACTPVLTKSRKVGSSGGVWAVDASNNLIVKCKANTADQVTGAATIVTEVY